MFENVGARDVEGYRIPTKKKLKELLTSDPSTVIFDCTSLQQQGRIIRGDNIPPGMTLSIVGPDPFRNRRWYATAVVRGEKVVVN